MKQKVYALLSLCLVLSLASCCKPCKKNKLAAEVDKEIALENDIISKAATEQEIEIVEESPIK
jgi:hypothetical protein